MITGIVNANHELLIRLPVRNLFGAEQEVEAILDTGFNGALALPPALVGSLGLTWVLHGSATLANGRTEPCDVYAANIIWDGVDRYVMVPAIDCAPLLGMTLLIGYDLRVRVAVGGVVEIEAIP
jgi:clan AA aspartic protease